MNFNEWKNALLNEDNTLLGRSGLSEWIPLNELRVPTDRTPCSNEFIFDIDSNEYEPSLNLAKNLEEFSTTYSIPFLRFSSGRLFHYSVFFDKTISIPDNNMWKTYYSERIITIQMVQSFLKDFRFSLFKMLTELIKPVENACFDYQVMYSKHMIRMEGAKNKETGYFKSLLTELPEEQPKITFDDVKYPEKIEHWSIPDDILIAVYNEYMKENKGRSFEQKKVILSAKYYSFIEKIHETPFRDGRKRVVDLLFIPYCKQIMKWDVHHSLKWIREWLDRSYALEFSRHPIYDYNITQKFNNSNLIPLSKKNIPIHFNEDDSEIFEVLSE